MLEKVSALNLPEVLAKHVAVATEATWRLEASNLLDVVHHRPDFEGLSRGQTLLCEIVNSVLNESGKRETSHPAGDKQRQHERPPTFRTEIRARSPGEPSEDASIHLGSIAAGGIGGQQFFNIVLALSEVFEELVERKRADARVPRDDVWFNGETIDSVLHNPRDPAKGVRVVASGPRRFEQPSIPYMNPGNVREDILELRVLPGCGERSAVRDELDKFGRHVKDVVGCPSNQLPRSLARWTGGAP